MGASEKQPVLLISDLHLAAEREQVNRLFFRFLRNEARTAHALYVLGDLFDYWIGDDDLIDPFHARVTEALHALSASGCTVYFMRGNRDFLIDGGFAKATGLRLLTDPSVADFYGTPTLLMHGDTLCTADTEYQDFRTLVRSPSWQQSFLAKPLAERRALALGARRQSELTKQGKPYEIMDVAPSAVVQAFSDYPCPRMIHGHTHRPARHEHLVAGRAHERWVLADWYDRGEYLRIDPSGIARVGLD